MLLPLLALAACRPATRAVMQDVPARTWEHPVAVTFDPVDTVELNDLYVVVRYNEAFVQDTLTLRIRTCSPDSLSYEEELQLVFEHRHHAAPLRSRLRMPYRRRVRFALTGTYRMIFTPTRRVKGIESVGLQIEKSH